MLPLVGEHNTSSMLQFRKPPEEETQLEESPRFVIGVDQRRVAVYVVGALIAGVLIGYGAAHFLTRKEKPPEAVVDHNVPEEKPAAANPAPNQYLRVSKVLRADTIEVEGVGTVRMIGVETPDDKAPKETYGAIGDSALAFAKESLLGRDVRIELDPGTDPKNNKDESGALLAYVFTRDGTLFNAELLKRGLAFLRSSDLFAMVGQFRALERDALTGARGVWGLSGSSSSSVGTARSNPLGGLGAEGTGERSRRLSPLSPSEIGPNIPALSGSPSMTSEPLVYVSAADRLYHKSGCQYLARKNRVIPLSQAKAEGYGPCGRCFASTVLKAP
jgi:micrococcal nuclease